jgi:hypothetical protein
VEDLLIEAHLGYYFEWEYFGGVEVHYLKFAVDLVEFECLFLQNEVEVKFACLLLDYLQ